MIWVSTSFVVVAFFVWCWFEWKNVRTRSLSEVRAFEKAKVVYGKTMKAKFGGQEIKPLKTFISGEVYVNEPGSNLYNDLLWYLTHASMCKEHAINNAHPSHSGVGIKYRVTFERLE